jgi:hypothetical protein
MHQPTIKRRRNTYLAIFGCPTDRNVTQRFRLHTLMQSKVEIQQKLTIAIGNKRNLHRKAKRVAHEHPRRTERAAIGAERSAPTIGDIAQKTSETSSKNAYYYPGITLGGIVGGGGTTVCANANANEINTKAYLTYKISERTCGGCVMIGPVFLKLTSNEPNESCTSPAKEQEIQSEKISFRNRERERERRSGFKSVPKKSSFEWNAYCSSIFSAVISMS